MPSLFSFPWSDVRLTVWAILEFALYDLLVRVGGFRCVHARLRALLPKRQGTVSAQRVSTAVSVACSFYWHPVMCLQRAVATTRILRKLGVPAELVIGCRMTPFFSHAWVEVHGKVINDSTNYPRRLLVLERV